METLAHPLVSVVVPTYNRSEFLNVTLETLCTQSYDRYEIIVVDNNSTDDTRAVVERWQRRTAVPMTYVFEPRQGVHYARNSALKYCRGEVLYYTDDDMVADIELLKEIVKPFSYSPLVAAVTGPVRPRWQQTPPTWVVDYCSNYLLSLRDRQEHLIISPYDCGVISCHQALRRDAFVKSGGYNPENTAGDWIGDGETGLNIKLQNLGYWFAHIGSAVTYHVIPSHRMTQDYLNKRLANEGNCNSYTDYRHHRYTKLQLASRVVSHCRAIIAETLKYLTKVVIGKPTWRLNRARLSYYTSRIRYDVKLMTDPEWQRMVTISDWIAEAERNSNQ